MRHFRAIAALAVLGCALVVPATASAQTQTLEFEHLEGTQAQLASLDCNPSGTSTATVTFTGIAGGPYPGTFEETVHVVFGSQAFGSGELTAFDASFTILSGETTITGTKKLILSPDAFQPATCSSVDAGAGCSQASLSAAAYGEALRYRAEIDGTQDEGFATARFDVFGLLCPSGFEGSGFLQEEFLISLPLAEPAFVTLEPATATNTVSSFHTVTATVTTATGEPVSGATVRFAVTGASTASGSCTTNGNGQCDFTYQVAPFPGSDAITAYVDVNDNSVQDAGEPSGAAQKTIVLPASTPGKATGGTRALRNQIVGQTEEVTFTLTARGDASGLQGECTLVDQVLATKIKCLDVLAYVQFGNEATIWGHAEQDGVPTLYRIFVEDAGEPAAGRDDFVIQTQLGYSAGGPVTEGNIQVHAP